MSIEANLAALTAAVEALTGALIASGAAKPAAAPATTAAAETAPKRGPGRPAKAAAEPAKPADDSGLGGEDDSGLGGEDDSGLGGDTPTVTPEEAKAAVLAYRDKSIKIKGKDDGLSMTRTLMNKFVKSLDGINAENAGAVAGAFNEAIGKLK